MSIDLVDELRATIQSSACVRPRGAATKLRAPANGCTALDMRRLAGVVDYQPTEFIITAWAGTPVAEVQGLLAAHGQYLPFDPLLTERGATLGGTVAANACGPERYRYGGVRDFIIGARFIDGNGNLIQGGGKVVKNAAGFDYPKLMVGSLGRLGALVEVTFKVFPKPEAYATLRVDRPSLSAALALLPKLTNCPYDLNAIDLVIGAANEAAIFVRVGGLAASLSQRMDRVRSLCGGGEIVTGDAEAQLWRNAREFAWVAEGVPVVKVPLTPSRIPALDARVPSARRRYSVGGNVAWIATSALDELDATLRSLDLAGLILLNAPDDPRIGRRTGHPFAERVIHALDPQNKFGPAAPLRPRVNSPADATRDPR
ncbi:MAG: FAD-binding protein [Chloroflexi bacterium]|jgi:glycolate oxidase FAD binding subunit|uniref:2-hydroxy-acid oxidase n=1 Tax=Candidatus Thermofonsia Clade 3 bacterium TaxID=2364212 RepID=A0A2M8QG25_9CHLR|nr:FAD-binding protein [Candidatus Roseilinea sp. NK_OTU-006]PJF48724.1 MAG: 2-hydroxy-acid oxidase [Candidatus Thermofonsia Clade 3 bacterium]RMG62903.1 MAG: FAD-binding protein [Chloroflexota bacterium]